MFDERIKFFLEELDKSMVVSGDKHLGQVLSITGSSHEPVFVFGNKGKFLGLLSPYSAIYQKRLPYSAKVSSAVTVPPKLDGNSGIYSVVDSMLSTRFYALPVFDKNNRITGVVKASKIFSRLANSDKLLCKVAGRVLINKPVTVSNDAKVKDAFRLLRQKKISRLLVVGEGGVLEGILTRNDLKNAFISPSPRQRFSKESGDTGQGMFDEEEITRNDLPLSQFINLDVNVTPVDTAKTELIGKLVRSGRNSIVLVDRLNRPKGFISNRDLLLAISRLKSRREISVVMEKPRNIGQATLADLFDMVERSSRKISRILPLKRFNIRFKEGKIGIGKPTFIETIMEAKFFSGENILATTQDRNILSGAKEALQRIYKKVRRSKDKKEDRN